MKRRIAIIGFGEAGSTFALSAGWGEGAIAYDINPARRSYIHAAGVAETEDAASAISAASIVLSLVTADAALEAAREYAPLLPEGAVWCDMNSVAPETKRVAATVIEAGGGRYVDVAVMAPVEKGLAVPLLLSGPHAFAALPLLEALGFTSLRAVGNEVGRASAIKMIRSVMVKGIETLSWECAAAAEAAGVLDEITASLDASEEPIGWAARFAYNRERMETHGARRAAEMEESARTLEALAPPGVMISAKYIAGPLDLAEYGAGGMKRPSCCTRKRR